MHCGLVPIVNEALLLISYRLLTYYDPDEPYDVESSEENNGLVACQKPRTERQLKSLFKAAAMVLHLGERPYFLPCYCE